MEVSNSHIRKLVAYYETGLDPRALAVLDLLFEKKAVEPLQRAFFNKHGAPYLVYPLDGSGVRFRQRTE